MSSRRPLQPLDLSLRHLGLQRARWAALACSVALTIGLPWWHLRLLARDDRGLVPLLGAPTSIRVGPLELVDPALVAGAALSGGLSWTLVWTVLPGVVLVLVLGRFFCGWACPYLPILAASQSVRWGLTRAGLRVPDLRLPRVTARVVLVGLLAVGAALGAQVLPLVYPPAVIGREAFRVAFFGSLGAGASLVLAAFLFDTFVSRAGFCRSLCPGGAMFSLVGTASPLRVVNDRSKCTDCTACDVVCNLGQSPMQNQLDSGCERCGRCVAVCPPKALSFTWRRAP